MSSLWTPDGERPVGRPQPEPSAPTPPPPSPPPSPPPRGERSPQPDQADQAVQAGEPTEAELEELRLQLARTPAAVVVANHVFGLFELAFLHLSLQPPQLEEARLAIDGAAALVEGLAGRLGEAEATAAEGLAQLRLAFVHIKSGVEAGAKTGSEPSGG